jgi:hypothetical protein
LDLLSRLAAKHAAQTPWEKSLEKKSAKSGAACIRRGDREARPLLAIPRDSRDGSDENLANPLVD